MPRRRVWIVVTDGARARHFRAWYDPDEGHVVRPVREEVYDPARRKGEELLADRPGRTQNRSHDMGRHAMEPDTDPKRVEKARFARHIAADLREAYNAGEFNELALVAAPRTLGDLRAALDDQLRGLVKIEVARDLTTLSDAELERELRPLIWPQLAK